MSWADIVLCLMPLEYRLEEPVALRVQPNTTSLVEFSFSSDNFTCVSDLFAAAGMRRPRGVATVEELSVFDKAITQALLNASIDEQIGVDSKAAIETASARGMDAIGSRRTVTSSDGIQLSGFEAGHGGECPVVFIGPPGMPLELSKRWLRGLSVDRRVVSWETRVLFGPPSGVDVPLGIDAQLSDANAMVNTLGLGEAHVIGVCGGAVLALAYAAKFPERVRSLSLWFGDFDLGLLAPKSAHQKNLEALLEMVVSRRVSASTLRDLLVGQILPKEEPDLAPLVLYPFANADVLHNYCLMNHPIMSTDCSPYLTQIVAPSFVGYSPDDTTTHPEGSRLVAKYLRADIEMIAGTAHLAGLKGRAQDIERIRQFHADVDNTLMKTAVSSR